MSARINIAGQNTQRTGVKGRGNKSSRRRLHDGRAKPKLKGFCETAYLFSRGVRTRANKYALPVLYPFTRYSSALPFSFDRAVRFFYDLLFVLRSPNFFLSLFSRLCVFSSVWNDPPQRTDENAASGRRERMRKPCDRENVCSSLDRKVKTRDLGSRVPSKQLGLLDKFCVCTWVRVCTCIERGTNRIFDVFVPRITDQYVCTKLYIKFRNEILLEQLSKCYVTVNLLATCRPVCILNDVNHANVDKNAVNKNRFSIPCWNINSRRYSAYSRSLNLSEWIPCMRGKT